MSKKQLPLAAFALLLAAAPVYAQTATTAPAETTAPAAPIDCAAQFTTLDLDKDGRLSEVEAASAYARARIDGTSLDAEGLTPETYAAICGASHWQAYSPEEGAPFEGANSFTEEQARDRAVSWDFTDVSALAQDDKGIWRGTAKQGGQDVDIAIDYKGNVVATPKS